MTDYTTYVGGEVITASSGGNYAGAPKQTVLVGTFDASKRGLAAADTATIVTIPAGTWVHQVFVEVVTPDDATHKFALGDSADDNGYVTVTEGDAAATAGTVIRGNGAYVDAIAAGVGKLYAADDAIQILANTGDPLDTLKIKITVVCTIVA
jgi:hypothetical protein